MLVKSSCKFLPFISTWTLQKINRIFYLETAYPFVVNSYHGRLNKYEMCKYIKNVQVTLYI